MVPYWSSRNADPSPAWQLSSVFCLTESSYSVIKYFISTLWFLFHSHQCKPQCSVHFALSCSICWNFSCLLLHYLPACGYFLFLIQILPQSSFLQNCRHHPALALLLLLAGPLTIGEKGDSKKKMDRNITSCHFLCIFKIVFWCLLLLRIK